MRNPEDQRHLIARAVLHIRSQRAASRRALADLMRLSPTTAGQYVDQLIASGHLLEHGFDQGPMGRPKRVLSANATAGWFMGVEFNAARVQAVRVDFSGRHSAGEPTRLQENAGVRVIMDAVKKAGVRVGAGAGGPLLGIGVGAPGVVDPVRGIALEYDFVPGWRDVRVVDQLRNRFRVPVTLENNLRAIALAERWFGGAASLSDYVILGPRSGFGMAIMHDGQLLRGASCAAGEIGRWRWPVNAPEGELHAALSAPAVWRRLAGRGARARLPADLHTALSAFAADEGSAWQALVHDYASVLGCIHLILDPHSYFLHGPLTALGPRFCDAIRDRLAALSPALRGRPVRLMPSALGDDAGALGAASMAMEAWMPD